jgi:hypothetical protein
VGINILVGVGAKLVVLVFEFQFGILRPVVASAAKLKAPARSASWLRLVAFHTALLARYAASGAPAVDHCDSDDAEKRNLVAMGWSYVMGHSRVPAVGQWFTGAANEETPSQNAYSMRFSLKKA